MITPTTMKNRFPEFVSIADSRIQLFIDDAVLELSPGEWADNYDRGLSYLAAHLLSCSISTAAGGGVGGMNGPVASRAVGDVSISFGSTLSMDAAAGVYNNTPYGQEYWRLVNLLGVGMLTV
jgi:hypothetical protein